MSRLSGPWTEAPVDVNRAPGRDPPTLQEALALASLK